MCARAVRETRQLSAGEAPPTHRIVGLNRVKHAACVVDHAALAWPEPPRCSDQVAADGGSGRVPPNELA